MRSTAGPLVATVASTGVGPNEAGAVAINNISFVNGQAQVTAKYKDAGRLRLHFKESSLRGETDAFVSPPAEMRVITVEDGAGNANPEATSATDTGFTGAGEAFRVVIDVLDAEGDRTPNFGNEGVPEEVEVISGQLVLPLGGRHVLFQPPRDPRTRFGNFLVNVIRAGGTENNGEI